MGKRPAKSTKKSWQKLEQEGLEDALNAESNALLRNAEPQFKENDELFFVDKKGSALKVGRKDAWELKCNSILKPNEKIEARKVFRSGKKKNTIQERIDQFAEEIREHGSVVSRKRRSESAPQASERSFDLWGDAGESKNEDQWPKLYKNDPLKLENAVFDEHHVPNNKRRHMARMRPEPSKIKPVEVVSAGASYRPDGGQHEELMRKAAAVLVEEEEKVKLLREKIGLEGEQRVKRSLLTKKGTIVGPDDVGGPDESDLQGSVEDEEEEGRKEEDKASSKAAKEKGKLTRAERNKQARHKEVLRAQAAAKEEKKLLKQINRVGEIKKEVENILKIREQASSLEASLKDEKEAERIKRLGKIKLQKEAPEVLLPEEIPTKLRAVKPVGNTLRDKFKNLQKRNLIEPRRSQAGKRKDKTLSVLKAHKIKARAFIDF